MGYDRPGCFGHAVTFNLKSPQCQECHASEECSVSAKARLDELSQVLNVDAILRMSHKQPKTAPAQEQPRFDADLSETARRIIARLPENAQRTAARLIRTNLNFRKVLLAGRNPIHEQKPVSVSVLFDLLLLGPVTGDQYLNSLRERVGHSPSIAASEASIGISIVTGLGIAVIEDGHLIIRKDKQ